MQTAILKDKTLARMMQIFAGGQLHGHKRDVRTARSVRHRRLLRAVLVEQEEAMDAADQIEQLQVSHD